MKILTSIATSYAIVGALFIGCIFHSGSIHCLTMVTMYGFLLLFMGQILMAAAFLLFAGGVKNERKT